MGGSLIPRGGHNILEPANYGKCILVGTHTENFTSEIADLLEADAILQVKDNHELGIHLVQLLKNDRQREEYGKNAANFMAGQAGILDRYHKQLTAIVDAEDRSI